MACIDSEFNEYAEKVKNLKSKPSDNDLLELYGLYKQATVGDNNSSAPSMLDFKGKSKWNAWNSRKGINQEEAKRLYIEVASRLIKQHGVA